MQLSGAGDNERKCPLDRPGGLIWNGVRFCTNYKNGFLVVDYLSEFLGELCSCQTRPQSLLPHIASSSFLRINACR